MVHPTPAQGGTDWKTIRINGLLYPCTMVRHSELATITRRVTTGPADKDSDDYISSWVLSDLTGGGQVLDGKESTDANRYQHGTVETRYPGQMTLPLKVVSTRPSGVSDDAVAYPIGDIGTQFYCCWIDGTDEDIYGFNETTDTWYATANALTTAPVNTAVWFQGADSAPAMFIPQGAAGYAWAVETTPASGTLTITVETGSATVPKALSFALWDNRLWAIDTSGVIHYTFEGQDELEWQRLIDDSPAGGGNPLKLDPAETPQNLIAFYDRSGNPTLHCVTDRAVWWLNLAAKKWELTATQFPPHPDNGRAVAIWRTSEDMWVSTGIGIVRTTPDGAIVPKAGLDRDNGLPIEFRGHINSLCPEWSSLYALVHGNANFDEVPDTVEDSLFDDESYLPLGTARSLLVAYSGTGWHPIWESADEVEEVSWIVLSKITNGYRLWWGAGADVHTMRLRKDFYNPREGLKAGLDTFQETASLTTMQFDGNMEGFDKLASRLVLSTEHTSATETITAYYQTNEDSYLDWHLIGTVDTTDTPARTSLPLNNITLPDGTSFSKGIRFNWIAFRFDLARGSDDTRTPLLDAATLHYTKIPQNVVSLVATIPLPLKVMWDRDGATMSDELRELLTTPEYIQVEHQDRLYRCQVAGIQGVDTPGKETSGTREVFLLEVAH